MEPDNPVREIQSRALDEKIKQMKEDFDQLDKLNIRSIPENIFVFNFLPFFCGEKVENSNYLLNTWLDIAGSNYKPVNVVDNNGKVVITVPPIHDNNAIEPVTNRRDDLSYMFRESREKSTLSPNLGINIVNDALGSRFHKVIRDTQNSPIKEKWLALFRHYGKTPALLDTPKEVEGDDFDY